MTRMIEWHDVSEKPECDRPYRLCLVWCRAHNGPITSGVPRVTQWCRDEQRFDTETILLSWWGGSPVITHWSYVDNFCPVNVA